MPRRKQQEPRRSAGQILHKIFHNTREAYMPEDELKAGAHDEEEHLQDDGLSLDGQDTEFLCNEEEEDVDGGQPPSYRDSPLSNGTNPDAGYGSPLSDASDRLTDFKSTSSRDGQEREGSALPFRPNNGISFQDSLAQMKAVYANLISDASWSSIAMDIMKSKPAAAGSVNSTLTTPEPTSTASVTTTTTTNKNSGVNMASSHHNGRSSSTTVNHTGSASGNTNGTAVSSVSGHSATSSSGSSSGGASNGSGVAYDWHQAALAKTLQQTPYHLLPEPSLFSTVQLYRQNNKLYGSVFTGASKFRCKDCSAAYDTLVGLTVHMNETGHYRDDNKDKEEDQGKRWSKPRKRSLMEMEGKEDAQKKVPLKEPVPALATKLVPTSAKKRAIQDAIVSPCSPDSVHAGSGGGSNGASYTWQFEARKAQILKCMECGSSHDTLQQLTAHMMVTEEKREGGEDEKVEGGEPLEKKIKEEKDDTGTPTWGGYPSIHAAYQLQGAMKSSTTVLPPMVQSVQMQPMFNSGLRGLELVEKVTGKATTVKKEKEEKMRERLPSPNDLSLGKPSGMRSSSPGSVDSELICKKEPKESLVDGHNNHSKNGSEACQSPVTNGNSLGIITDHSPESPFINPLSALQSIMNTHLAFNPAPQGKPAEPVNHYPLYDSSDQPIDLSKNKSTTNSNNNNNNNSSSVLLTNNSINEKSDADGSAFEDTLEDLSPVQKRKGRQSNWNPQHLLILQAQFASSLRETPEGRYAMTDLGPQERVHICKFTGLSMTTISHWLANVKYQLRRTGGTKTPSSYISHLESHLGFSLKDLSKLSAEHLREQQAASKCRLCNRTFVSKHAVKLHLSKTHGKSPEDHLVFVTALEKLEKLDKIEKVHEDVMHSVTVVNKKKSCEIAEWTPRGVEDVGSDKSHRTKSTNKAGLSWTVTYGRALALALIPLHHPLPHPLSHGDMEGPQCPIMMTDGVSGMGEEEEGWGGANGKRREAIKISNVRDKRHKDQVESGEAVTGASSAAIITANMVHSQFCHRCYFLGWTKQARQSGLFFFNPLESKDRKGNKKTDEKSETQKRHNRRLTEAAMCFIFEPNARIASHRFALKEQGGIALVVEEERRPAICHGTVHPISETRRNEVDIGGNKRGRFTKFASCLSMKLAGEGESSHQRRPVHHLSSCRALLRVAVLLGERQWVRLEVRPGREEEGGGLLLGWRMTDAVITSGSQTDPLLTGGGKRNVTQPAVSGFSCTDYISYGSEGLRAATGRASLCKEEMSANRFFRELRAVTSAFAVTDEVGKSDGQLQSFLSPRACLALTLCAMFSEGTRHSAVAQTDRQMEKLKKSSAGSNFQSCRYLGTVMVFSGCVIP
ncbi:hypothetical protein L3Q82_002477 [Scortum barcoo]|uniref:Uncharacterized protein n=1 Tax=Scortum barcoo TaxID=214431 RepID=A0ACB8VYC3_9TELE|nr:hypothetical protein L3Q82_002477 [Scortum barcoo]